MALQIKQALDLIEEDLVELIKVLANLAARHRGTVMVARTHGQFAIPTTFGFKIAGYTSEMMRDLERLRELRPRVCVGKMSGAVGTGAGFGESFFEVQDLVMKDLGLQVEEAATQIVCRDRYAELAAFLALLVTACERYATEVRNLQRTEIARSWRPSMRRSRSAPAPWPRSGTRCSLRTFAGWRGSCAASSSCL